MISVPVNKPLLDGNEKKYLIECIDSGWISSEGPFVRAFEDKFANRMGRKYGIAVCNGSVALETSVRALNLGPGDEVLLPTFTIVSCASAIVRSGATPVLVDSDPKTWNMDVTSIEAKITPRTKAIMPVHIYGLPSEMAVILELAERYQLKVIEDAAEMHGQAYRGRPCGSFGDLSVFSFYPNKHITTGEGGMILTNDPLLAERCRQLRNLCFTSGRRFVHEELGWNFRMTSLQAALGLAQLERLDEFVDRKRKMGALYTSLLGDLGDLIQLPMERTNDADNIYWVFGIVLKDKVSQSAETVMSLLQAEGIGTRPFFFPMHLQPVFKNSGLFKAEQYPISEILAKRGFYLPSGVAITEREICYVADVLKNILKRAS